MHSAMRARLGLRCALAHRWQSRGARANWLPGSRSAAAVPEATNNPTPERSAEPPPPAATPPPSAAPPPPASETPPPPAPGLRCGGFFFAVDPNIGLWNDRLNPTWRLTFTDLQRKEKQRVPYAFDIRCQGPHAELAVRFQFGYVNCDGTFGRIPERLEVQHGWEVTFPLPLSGLRLSQAVISAEGQAGPTNITIYYVDWPFGLCAGIQKMVEGSAVKGKPELSWRGEVAMGFFVLATLWSVYSLVTLPSTWQETIEILFYGVDDESARAMFDMLDTDGDGYITQEDVRSFARNRQLSDSDADQLWYGLAELDATGFGRVNYESFEMFVDMFKAGSFDPSSANTLDNTLLRPPGTGLHPGFGNQRMAPPLAGHEFASTLAALGGVGPRLTPSLVAQTDLMGTRPRSTWQ